MIERGSIVIGKQGPVCRLFSVNEPPLSTRLIGSVMSNLTDQDLDRGVEDKIMMLNGT
jgi:hypothetical protein